MECSWRIPVVWQCDEGLVLGDSDGATRRSNSTYILPSRFTNKGQHRFEFYILWKCVQLITYDEFQAHLNHQLFEGGDDDIDDPEDDIEVMEGDIDVLEDVMTA